jgi:hypothetical protein
MGEEQDKFALAVIIFKLLNNGIHPFSGVVKKNADSTLSIQERIEQYHYAYGMWGDSYQAPHPYSLHEFLPQSTLKLFDRAFMKGQQRPSAAEWQAELDYLLKNLKRCKKNPNHAYFTNKGCGLCASEERLKANLKTIQEQKTAPRKLRGFEVNTLSKENMEEHKQQRRQTERQEERITYVLVMLYSLLMIFLPRLAMIYHETLQDLGISLQLILMILFFNFLHAEVKKQRFFLTKMLGSVILNTLITYTYGCVAMAFVLGNKIDWMHLFGLS